MEKFLKIENIKKSFSKKVVLDNITFSINNNEIVGLLGRNGSGKSTLMKIISGLQNPDSGTVEIMGFNIAKDRENALKNLGISIESPALYASLTGVENLKMMSNWTKTSKKRVDEIIEYVGIGEKINNKVSTYSMGMKMRLMLGMVIMPKPKLVVLDEPMNGLDPDGVIELREELLNLKKEGCAVLFSSHQLSEVEKISDKIVMIEKGNIVYNGRISDGPTNKVNYLILTDNNKKAVKALESSRTKFKFSEELDRENYIEISMEIDELDEILSLLKSNNLQILDIEKRVITLESLYKELRIEDDPIEN